MTPPTRTPTGRIFSVAASLTLALAIHAVAGAAMLQMPTQGQRYLSALAAAADVTRVGSLPARERCARLPG